MKIIEKKWRAACETICKKTRNFYRETIAIAIPISLQSIITIGVNMMDNIMVGSLGETVLSGVSLANQYISFVSYLLYGNCNGGKCTNRQILGHEGYDSVEVYSYADASLLCWACAAFL